MIAICPACVASLAMVAAGVTSGGGLTAFTAAKIFKRKTTDRSKQRKTKEQEKEEEK